MITEVSRHSVFHLSDESGYKFTVEAREPVPGDGYIASCNLIGNGGLRTARGSMASLLHHAKALVHMLEAEIPPNER